MAPFTGDGLRTRPARRPQEHVSEHEAERCADLFRRRSSVGRRLAADLRLLIRLPGLEELADQRLSRLRRTDELRQRLEPTREGLVRTLAEFRKGLRIRISDHHRCRSLLELPGRDAGSDQPRAGSVRPWEPRAWGRDLF